jgi:hypothetical protein
VNRNVMGPAAPYKDRPEYVLAQQYANDIADLLAPQVGQARKPKLEAPRPPAAALVRPAAGGSARGRRRAPKAALAAAAGRWSRRQRRRRRG